jgi:hypothetical protein
LSDLEKHESLKEKLEALKARREQLLGSLGALGQNTTQSADSLDMVAKDSEKEARRQFGGIEEHYKEAVKVTRADVKGLSGKVGVTRSSGSTQLSVYGWSTRIIWVAFCLILAASLVVVGMGPGYLVSVIFLFVIGEVSNELYLRSRRTISRIEASQIDSQLKSLDDGLESAVRTSPKPAIDFSSVKQFASTVTSGLKQVAVTLTSLTPVIKQLSSLEDQYAKQLRTIEDVQYALRRYNFDEDQKLLTNLTDYSSASINDDVWASDLLRIVRESKGVSEEILKLLYYDSIGRTSSTATYWEIVKKDQAKLGELARLLVRNNLVRAPNENQSTLDTMSILLVEIPEYNLERARSRVNAFFDDLKVFKIECINHLNHYGLSFQQRESEITGLIPHDIDSRGWRKEVIDKIAAILGLDSAFIALLISESLGDYEASLEAWNSIVKRDVFQDFAKLLIHNVVVRSTADPQIAVNRPLVVMKSMGDKFSFRDVSTELAKLEAEILRVRRSIIFCCNQYSIQVDSSSFGLDFVPDIASNIELEFVKSGAQLLRVEPPVFRLLYATTTGSLEAIDLFSTLKKDTKLPLLSGFLLTHNLLPSNPFSENLVHLLSMYSSFDLREISSAFEYYDRLNALAQNLVIFVEENGLGSPKGLSFLDIVRICPTSPKLRFEEGVVRLLSELASSSLGGKNLSSGEKLEVVSASATLFLYVQNDQAATSLCRKVGFMKLGSRVLYEYAKLSDEVGLTQIKPTIKTALDASSSPLDNDRHYASFVDELISGILHIKVTYLLSKQVAEIRDLLEAVEKRGFEAEQIAENLRASVNDTLEKQVDNDIVSDLLLRQVLSAYMITVPGTDPVIKLVDDYLEGAAEALAKEKDDQSFLSLIMKKKGLGSWTRVGLVPFGMTFEQFTRRYDEVAEKAKEMYRQSHQTSTETLTHFLIRILPSSDAMKVGLQDPQRRLSPITTVRELIEEKMPGVDSLQVLTVTQSTGTSAVKLRSVIESVIDSNKSNIRALLGDTVTKSIAKYEWLSGVFEKKSIETRLFEEFGTNRLSSLAISIAKLGKVDEASVLGKLRKCVDKALPRGHALDADDAKILSSQIYQALRGIGVVLTT